MARPTLEASALSRSTECGDLLRAELLPLLPFRFTREGHAQARPLFERAMELDPNYAEAYALLGVSYGVECMAPPGDLRTARVL